MSASIRFEIGELAGAVLSADQAHRYWLWRIWDRSLPMLVVCMFNPSTADARKDDPTISRLCEIARRWGYGGVLVVNLYSMRTSDPSKIDGREREAFGDGQFEAWAQALDLAASGDRRVLVAWGNLATQGAAEPFLAAASDLSLICLGRTARGQPKHPAARGKSRVPADQMPEVWP